MGITWQAILPGAFDASAFRFEMEDTLSRLGFGILLDFYKTVSTWDTQPVFESETNINDQLMEVHVYCDALRDGDRVRGARRPQPAPVNLVYYFLNEGTAVRYATMSPDFRPKSRVRTLGSFPGQGGIASVSVLKPRPGIVARKWDEEIKKKYDRFIHHQLRGALVRGVRRSGHAYQ